MIPIVLIAVITCSVSGRVNDSHTAEGLKDATLHLTLRNEPANTTAYAAVSEPDGSFQFENIEPGDYSLSAEHSGYIQTKCRTPINISAGQKITDLKLQLTPQAAISGRVLDQNGKPKMGVTVEALNRKPPYFPLGTAATDDEGEYRISNLRPGQYYVAAQSRGQRTHTFYPASPDRAGATPLELTPGLEIPSIDIRMRAVQTFHIRGKLALGPAEKDTPRAMIMLWPQDDPGPPHGANAIAKDGSFDVAGVPPGVYRILCPGRQVEIVEVSSKDLNNVVLIPQPVFTLRGSVELESGPADLENVQVMLMPVEESLVMANVASAMTTADGTFTMEKVTPGKFRVRVMILPEGSYVKSIRFGNQETLGKNLDLTQASGGEIHVVLHTGAAQVSGMAASASVVLIPEDLTLNGGAVHTAVTNQSGAFTVTGVEPGVYYAAAYETDEYQTLADPVILKQLVDKGTKIELRENDRQQLQLTLPGQ
jgi:hypothetical protein